MEINEAIKTNELLTETKYALMNFDADKSSLDELYRIILVSEKIKKQIPLLEDETNKNKLKAAELRLSAIIELIEANNETFEKIKNNIKTNPDNDKFDIEIKKIKEVDFNKKILLLNIARGLLCASCLFGSFLIGYCYFY